MGLGGDDGDTAEGRSVTLGGLGLSVDFGLKAWVLGPLLAGVDFAAHYKVSLELSGLLGEAGRGTPQIS